MFIVAGDNVTRGAAPAAPRVQVRAVHTPWTPLSTGTEACCAPYLALCAARVCHAYIA